jgi:hypothetical protein
MSFTLKLALFAACLVTAEAMAINIGAAQMPSFRPDGTPCYFMDCFAPAGGYGQSIQSIQGGQREQPAKRPPRHQRYRQP